MLLFLLVSVVSLLVPISAFALTPAADLSGVWSGFYQTSHYFEGELGCRDTLKINAEITQDYDKLTIKYTAKHVKTETLTPEKGQCLSTYYEWNDVKADGKLDGSRITVFDLVELSGWYASSGIKLEGSKQNIHVRNSWVDHTIQMSPTGFTPPTFESKQELEPKPAPEQEAKSEPSTNDGEDKRCPAEYPVYVEKTGLCQADFPIDSRCTIDHPIYLEEYGVCATAVRVAPINVTPLSELDDFSKILEEGKRLLKDDKNYSKAILYFQKAVLLDPEYFGGVYNLAETLYNHGDKKASVEHYYKILELSPGHFKAKQALTAMNLPLEPPEESLGLFEFFAEMDEMERESLEMFEEMDIMLKRYSFENYDDEYYDEYDESSEEYYEYEREKRQLDDDWKKLRETLKKLKEQQEDAEWERALDAWIEFQKQVREDELKSKKDGSYEYYKLKELLIELENELYLSLDCNNYDCSLGIERVPEWIKNNARWWAEDKIDDTSFKQGISHMIKEKIINIKDLPSASGESESKIPSWIKQNAKWWADGVITEDDFVNGLKYMIEKRIISVD